MRPQEKFRRLKRIIADMGSVLVAFSGGADSTFLLKTVSRLLPRENILAVTADSPTYPRTELSEAKKLAAGFGVRHKVIRTRELRIRDFVLNPRQRCYFCKKELFGSLKKLAASHRLKYVLDASNLSDKKDFRPGRLAKKELGIRSPLEEAGLNKEEIRVLSRGMGLSTWDKPAAACLASRIPYGVKITPALLRRIERAEACLRDMGFRQARLRHHGRLCRIEVPGQEITRLAQKQRQIVDKIKVLGYNYVTLDLEGYRTGSMNE